MKSSYNISHFIIFFCVSFALLLLTKSWLMTLGILMLLLLIDRLLINYDNRRRLKQEQRDNDEEERNNTND